ncbi:MAG: IclR family transcriptional regulator [Syntrophorhabdales bacterium]|jgi:DNA-binding IclR family transcriptional regulator
MYDAPILKKAVEVLKLIVREGRPMGTTDIARSLALSKSTTFGILKSLEEEGILVKDPLSKKFNTGNTLFELAKKIVRSTDVAVVARPFLVHLIEAVDETVLLGIREEDKVRVVDILEVHKDFKISSQAGTRMELTAGVVGKVFLSSVDNEEVLNLLEHKGLPRYTENSIVDPDRYLEELEKTRAQGYAIDREEYLKGVTAVAALIYSGHFPIAAVWVVGFTSSMGDKKLPDVISHLKATAEQISTRLSPFVSDKAARGR